MSTITTLQICALLLGGATVGHYAPKVVARAKPVRVAPSVRPSATQIPRAEPSRGRGTAVLDCPTQGVGFPDFKPFTFDTPKHNEVRVVYVPSVVVVPGGGGGGGGYIPPTTPPNPGAVPEPVSWGMLIVGFGFVGASCRRRRHRLRYIGVAQR